MTFVQGLQQNRTSQRGAAAVEFGLVAILLFTLLLGIIELGRFMYVWNTVQEVTRRAAREAVVSNFILGVDAIQREAIFRSGEGTGTVALPGGGEVTNARVSIQYLNAARNPIGTSDLPSSPADNISACLDTARKDVNCIRYVEASLWCGDSDEECNLTTHRIKYKPMIGLFPFLNVDIPASTVVMPAESLGYRP